MAMPPYHYSPPTTEAAFSFGMGYTQQQNVVRADFINGNIVFLNVPQEDKKPKVEKATSLEKTQCEYCRTIWIYNPNVVEKIFVRLECEACGARLDLL